MKFHLIALLIISAIIMGEQPALGNDLHVPHDYSSIKEALVNSEHGDRIFIAPGIYYEIDLVVPPGVTLSGLGAEPSEVIIDAQGRGRIMLCESLDSTTIIQNMTFTNGAATGTSAYDQSGGAILINNSILRLINCNFINNSAEAHGGAIRCSHSTPQIINCNFEGNTAPLGGGGALDCSYDSSPLLQNCFFKENEALWGGALSCRANSSPVSYQCGFDRNQAFGRLGYGGAVMADYESQPMFQKCTFYGNIARYGGALASFHGAKTNLDGCTVVGNSSAFLGGGMLCIDSFPTIDNSIFAFQDGAGIACGGTSLPMINCTDIFGNNGGDWYGTIAPQSSINGNISLDPLFCNPDPGQDFLFHLAPDSPCADQGGSCPQMGAWSSNCEITPTYIFNFESEWSQGIPRISWSLADQSSAVDFVLKRSLEGQPENQVTVPFQLLDFENFVAFDHLLQPEPGQDFLYHLYLRQRDETLSLISQVRLSGLGMLQPLHINDTWPNPFNPRTTISFEVSHDLTVTVAVRDIRGRTVRELAHQLFAAGRHELVWNGKDDRGRQVESGAYFITVQSEYLMSSQKVLLLK